MTKEAVEGIKADLRLQYRQKNRALEQLRKRNEFRKIAKRRISQRMLRSLARNVGLTASETGAEIAYPPAGKVIAFLALGAVALDIRDTCQNLEDLQDLDQQDASDIEELGDAEICGMDFKEIMATIRANLESYKEECQNRIQSQSIMKAIESGDTQRVKTLIESGENIEAVYPHVNTFSDGHNPLIIAARDNHLDIVRLLIDAGADVDVFDWVFKGYPLHKATYNGRPDVLREILKSPKINKDVVNVKGQINGYTPLIDALWHGFEECAQILLDHPMCTLGHIAHDGKNEYDVACQVFGMKHALTEKIKGRINNKT
ncbi:MAG: ankyrin repeat domain-containing protein [Alphaproteobacteria bacterium]|nr:ankyrin repeat domain-containing protein [Alphaproteobacteria bacterium]